MGASFSTWMRWDDTAQAPDCTGALTRQIPSSQELTTTPAEAAPIHNFAGPSLFQGAQNLTINGGVFNLNNQQGTSPQDPEHLRNVLDFLSLVNFRSIQQENLGKWTPDTLKWLLEGSMFQWWLETQSAILWGTGMPGAGKTVLASVVIKHLQALAQASSDVCVAFVYCRYTEPMKVRDILAALVRQLLERFPHLLSVVEDLHTQHSLERTTPTQAELIGAIRKIFSCFRIAYLFIDGLDEALYDEQFDLLDTLKTVHANFFITSRPLIRLKDVLLNVEFFTIAAQQEDIELLVFQHIERNPELRQVLAADEQRAMVITKICQASHGMFLHASLMIETVRHCTNSRHVMEKLEKLPTKLDVLYDEAFKRIEMQPEEHAALAKCVLLWVAYACCPLSVDDLRYAVASNPRVDWATPGNLVPEALLVSVCCGLITLENNSHYWGPVERTVRFVHYTALDAVKRILERSVASPHRLLAELCVERLMHHGVRPMDFATPFSDLPQGENRRLWSFAGSPLLGYARISWLIHARESIWCPFQPAFSILQFLAMCKYFPPSYRLDDQWRRDNPTAPIHLLLYFQLPNLLPFIHTQVNERTQKGRSALCLAAWENDGVMAKHLLKLDGIDVNLQDRDGNTALMLAAGRGSQEVVEALLLDHQININSCNGEGKAALHCALLGTGTDNMETALLLIAAPGINVNLQDRDGNTALMLAAGRGSHEVVEALLLDPQIDINSRNGEGKAALHCTLLGTGADDMETALLLIAAPGIDVNLQDKDGNTALMLAAGRGSLQIVKALLLDPRIDIQEHNEEGETALHHALHGTRTAHTEVAWYLIAAPGIDINAVDDQGRTPLMLAWNHPISLLDRLAQYPNTDLLKRVEHRRRPLMHACHQQRSSAVQQYLQLPGVDTVDNSGASALAHRAHLKLPRAACKHYPYPTSEQYTHKHLSDFQALVAAGLGVNHRDEKCLTALHQEKPKRVMAINYLFYLPARVNKCNTS